MGALQQCLRPPNLLVRPHSATLAASYRRFYVVARTLRKMEADADNNVDNTVNPFLGRTETLLKLDREHYPRFPKDRAVKSMSCRAFLEQYAGLAKDSIVTDQEVTVAESRIRNRHVDLRVNQRAAQILQLRSSIISEIRKYLENLNFMEVQTPILANSAGGAIARSFTTKAVEFTDRHIELRTAPELWLKRLVLGGFDKIFELGPCFRNEGIDKTHNPEFTTCEFYAAYQNLEQLITMTQAMFQTISNSSKEAIRDRLELLETGDISFDPPYSRLDFVKEIESAMDLKFPDLAGADAEAKVVEMFHTRNIQLPALVTLPRLLDRLSSEYLEPRCQAPTWIIHQPECLSPLSKSFVDPDTQQRVSARAELYVGGKELVNTYEEENSPFEQRRKFQEQVKYRRRGANVEIDENYLQALEWGLPPTGGWGCGIDRLVMLLSGADRINDVLPFGNLRNVVSLGTLRRDQDENVIYRP
ncbi:MAG: hypothetical protein Q9219_006367 [cf. Caloplaca sp. 3 TL-2023]